MRLPLSPQAAERVARESAVQPFEGAAKSMNHDWGTSYEAKQIQRWAEKIGEEAVARRDAEAEALERGERPCGPANDPELLVVGVDGGRVQSREKNAETGSRWRENKVVTVTSMLRGDGKDKPPLKLVTSQVATMSGCESFGTLARLEAERRGIRQAREVIFIGDGANWIDPLWEKHFARCVRIIDYCHALEHLGDVARAVYPEDESKREALRAKLKEHLWHGRIKVILKELRRFSAAAGEVRDGDGPDHPRRVLRSNVGYFERHRAQMDYPTYRSRGWPIASGITESGVKQFNKRVKGTDQFWSDAGVESIMALRGLWISQDDRWNHYPLWSTSRRKAA